MSLPSCLSHCHRASALVALLATKRGGIPTSAKGQEYPYGTSGKFTIAQSITVTSPSGPVSWAVGSPQTITWTSVGVSGNVNIDLSRDDGRTWTPIASNTANDGTEDWTVTGPATNNAKIRVTSVDTPSVSGTSGKFTIK